MIFANFILVFLLCFGNICAMSGNKASLNVKRKLNKFIRGWYGKKGKNMSLEVKSWRSMNTNRKGSTLTTRLQLRRWGRAWHPSWSTVTQAEDKGTDPTSLLD